MENQIEKKMEDEMETLQYIPLKGYIGMLPPKIANQVENEIETAI